MEDKNLKDNMVQESNNKAPWNESTGVRINNMLKEEDVMFSENQPTDMSIILGTQLNSIKHFSGDIVSEEVSKELEKAYLNGELNKVGIVDTVNFPQNVPDKETCQALDVLLSKNSLPFREVRYLGGGSRFAADTYEEYSFEDRKFVRVQATNCKDANITLSDNRPIIEGNYYWFEVEPIEKEMGKKII